MVKDLGLVISKQRNMKNLSQEKLADLIGVSRQAIVNWEENKSTPSLIGKERIILIERRQYDQNRRNKNIFRF